MTGPRTDDDTVFVPRRPAARAAAGPGLRTRLIERTGFPGPAGQRARWQAFLDQTDPGAALAAWFGDDGGDDHGSLSLAERLERDIAALDHLLARQVDAILHHRRLQQMEALWRGVAYLLTGARPRGSVRVKILPMRWGELRRDLLRHDDIDRTRLWELVYDTEFGQAGGQPFGLLLGDYEMGQSGNAQDLDRDLEGLERLGQIGAAAFCPVMVGVHCQVFERDHWHEITPADDLAQSFRRPDLRFWRDFQSAEDSRFIGMVLPPVVMRPPHDGRDARPDGFPYREKATRPEHMVWGNAIFPFGAVVIRAFAAYHWSADIRGVRRDSLSGGLVADLPRLSFATDRAGRVPIHPTALSLTATQEIQLGELGLLPLTDCQHTPYSAFFGNMSVQVPRVFDSELAAANARLSAMLQYILCASRFAHYVKVIARDWIGSIDSARELERRLQDWINGFCNRGDDMPVDERVRFPLREAQVAITGKKAMPGQYEAVITLKPHFQLDRIVSNFKLVTTLAGPSVH